MTLRTLDIADILMGIRGLYPFSVMAVEAKLLIGPDQEILVDRHMRTVAEDTLSGIHGPMQHFIFFPEIIMTLITQVRW